MRYRLIFLSLSTSPAYFISAMQTFAGQKRAKRGPSAHTVAQRFPDIDIEQQTVVGAGDQRVPGIPVHHCQIAGRHVALSFVNPVDQCSPVDIVELKIIVAMLRIRLIYIVCDQKDTAALGEFTENIVEVFRVQDIAGEILNVIGQLVRCDCLGSMMDTCCGDGHK